MSSVKFGNYTIISDSEGGWMDPELGFIAPGYQFKKLFNANGELAIPVATGGTDHKITVIFANVAVNSTDDIEDRIAGLKALGVRSLEIPEYPDIDNCIFVNAEKKFQRQGTYAISGTLSITAVKNLTYTLTFRQLF